MTSAQYLLAKYVQDVQRMEPVNIGIIVWTPEGVAARFLAERENRPGEVNGQALPRSWSLPAYKQWVQYWRSQLSKEEIVPATGGNPVRRSSPTFIEALKSSNRGNFLLESAGLLLDPLDSDEVVEAADYLFNMLVAKPSSIEDSSDLTLEERIDELITETGLRVDPNFHNQYPVPCQVANGQERFEFSHAYTNGNLRLYQRLPISGRNSRTQKKNIHDSAWMFEKVIQAQIIQPDQGAILIHADEEQVREPELANLLLILRSITRVFNLNQPADIKNEFLSLPSLPH